MPFGPGISLKLFAVIGFSMLGVCVWSATWPISLVLLTTFEKYRVRLQPLWPFLKCSIFSQQSTNQITTKLLKIKSIVCPKSNWSSRRYTNHTNQMYTIATNFFATLSTEKSDPCRRTIKIQLWAVSGVCVVEFFLPATETRICIHCLTDRALSNDSFLLSLRLFAMYARCWCWIDRR